MTKAKKLIEVAMPIKEISAESVRDKSIRHGHISTLHLWWARRPLPVCRAVVFASLVPDPLDENCPAAFREAVEVLLSHNLLYTPYPDIPYTSVYDPMPDTLRNRLLMFIGKFSDACQKNMLAGKSTPAKDQIQEKCLIKWESRNDKEVMNLARKLIWVAYNAEQQPQRTYSELSTAFEEAYKAIEEAEEALYNLPDRHLPGPEVEAKETALQAAIRNFQNQMPSVFDPFAGGGAIPLEAARLGCRSFGNDINPVAHIIEKGSVEFPQRYGKPITYTHDAFLSLYGDEGAKLYTEKFGGMPAGNIELPNRLAFDVEYYAKKIIEKSKAETKSLYSKSTKNTEVLVYYWARTAYCSNPSCGAEIPLLKQFYISKRRNSSSNEWIYLNPIIKNNTINFSIKNGICNLDGWNKRGNITCPCCGNITTIHQLKEQFKQKKNGERLLAIIEEDKNGLRKYRIPSENDIIVSKVKRSCELPKQNLEIGNVRNFNTPGWGFSTFESLFSDRQSVILESILNNIKSIEFPPSIYGKCLLSYMAILFDKILCRNTSFGVWHKLQETVEHPFGRQAIPMVFDYPEMNPFSKLSGGCYGQLQSIIDYIESENNIFTSYCNNTKSGDKKQFDKKSLTCVITDPPYYDAIAYGDLSDFFYVWLKDMLSDCYPLIFSLPKTPKQDECTALKHHHDNSEKKAKFHFENMLTSILKAIEYQTNDIVSIMFAHQSTEAWTTLCNSILSSKMNLTSSWPIDTEVSVALKNNMATLESSVTVACRPSERQGYASFKKVKKDIEDKVTREVNELYQLGFRGADLLTACFGQAVSEFGKYENVEKADGSEVKVSELLELARTTALNALLHGFDGDEYSRFYIAWLQMNGIGETDFDDAAKFARVGISVDIKDVFDRKLLIRDGNKQHLASYAERTDNNDKLGADAAAPLIDQVQRAMAIWKSGNREKMLRHIKNVGSDANNSFWRVLSSLKELLPDGDDRTQVQEIIANSADLIQHCNDKVEYRQGVLFE